MDRAGLTRLAMVLACVLALSLVHSCSSGGGGGHDDIGDDDTGDGDTGDDDGEEEPAPWEEGPFNVGSYGITYSNEFGDYHGKIYYPAVMAGEETPALDPPDGVGYPGIVVGNGFAAPNGLLKWITRHLASYGFIVLEFTSQNPFSMDVTLWAEGFSGGIDKLSEENQTRDRIIFGILDPEWIGVLGISMGGAGVIEITGKDNAGPNPRIDAAVGLAPAYVYFAQFVFDESLAQAPKITVPTQIFLGTNDCLVSGSWEYYNALSDRIPRMYIEPIGANHVNWIDEGLPADIGNLLLDCDPDMPHWMQHHIGKTYFTSWFMLFLKGRDKYRMFVHGPAVDNDPNIDVIYEGTEGK